MQNGHDETSKRRTATGAVEGKRFSRTPWWREGVCTWCGDRVADTRAPVGDTERLQTVCARCVSNRKWIKTCIEHSPWAARYVARWEEKLGAARDARIKAAGESRRAEATKRLSAPDPEPRNATFGDVLIDHQNNRIAELEEKIRRLYAALGEKEE